MGYQFMTKKIVQAQYKTHKKQRNSACIAVLNRKVTVRTSTSRK